MTNNDDIEQVFKKFHNDNTEKDSLIMVKKQFKKFHNDYTKQFIKVP